MPLNMPAVCRAWWRNWVSSPNGPIEPTLNECPPKQLCMVGIGGASPCMAARACALAGTHAHTHARARTDPFSPPVSEQHSQAKYAQNQLETPPRNARTTHGMNRIYGSYSHRETEVDWSIWKHSRPVSQSVYQPVADQSDPTICFYSCSLKHAIKLLKLCIQPLIGILIIWTPAKRCNRQPAPYKTINNK